MNALVEAGLFTGFGVGRKKMCLFLIYSSWMILLLVGVKI